MTVQIYGGDSPRTNPFELTAQITPRAAATSLPAALTPEQARQIGLTLLTTGLITDEQFQWGKAFRVTDGGISSHLLPGSIVYAQQLDPSEFKQAIGKVIVIATNDAGPSDYFIGRVKRISRAGLELTHDADPVQIANIPHGVRTHQLFLITHLVGIPVL